MDKNLDALEPSPINLHDIPELKEIHVREGVTLRPMKAEDAPRILEILDAEPTIRDRVSVASRMHTADDVADQVETYERSPHLIRYTLLDGDRPIGLVSLWRDIDNPFDAPDSPNDYGFGYFLDPAERGKGLVTDAVQTVMDTTQKVLHVENFVAYCEDNNSDSIDVLVKLGFEPTNTTYEEQSNGWLERKYVRPVTQTQEGLDLSE
jgi:RimJ/RimL family protein N-acetyltransferase